jgi:putative transposase
MKEVLETQMHNSIDAHLEQMRAAGLPDRRNSSFPSHLLTEVGDLELRIPRTRTLSARALLKRFARRTVSVVRMILVAFLLGFSTCKVGPALLSTLGEPISPSTVSQIAKQLDQSVEAYHQWAPPDHYEVLILDGIVMRRNTGTGAQRRTMLVALGIKPDGKKEIIDFRQTTGESQSTWEGFLNHLFLRGLEGHTVSVTHSLSPQGRGKIERPYGWLQNQLIRTCVQEDVTDIQHARRVLSQELHRYNYRQVHSTT